MIPREFPCILIGGGLDSTIILYHLSRKIHEPIKSYTVGYEGQENEFAQATKIAKHFNTIHKNILIKNLLKEYPSILRSLTFPRFSIWIYWAIKQASDDGGKTCYIGEGADEHFGGYWYKPKKSYLENWLGLLQWGIPTYQQLFNIFNMQFEAPFMQLDWRETLPFYDYEQHKFFLRKAYRGILPEFILNRKKKSAGIDYRLFWEKELEEYFPNATPSSDGEIRELWQALATRIWLQERHTVKVI